MKTHHAVLICALVTGGATGQPIIDLDHTFANLGGKGVRVLGSSPVYRVDGESLAVEEAAAVIRKALGVEEGWWRGAGPSTVVTFRCAPDASIRWVEKALAEIVGATAKDPRGGLPVSRIDLRVKGLGDPIRISVLAYSQEQATPGRCVYLRPSTIKKDVVQISMDSRFRRRDAAVLVTSPDGELTTRPSKGFPALEVHIKNSSREIKGPVFIASAGDVPVAGMLPVARHLASRHNQPVAFESLTWRADTTLSAHLRGQRRAAVGQSAPGSPDALARGGAFGTRKSARKIGVSRILAAQGWLADKQRQDGTWMSDADGDPVASTGLALLAYVEPHLLATPTRTSHRFGAPHSDTITAGLEALMARQDKGGRFGDGPVLGHAIATVAMIQAHRFSNSGVLELRAQRAWDALIPLLGNARVFGQEPKLAGWATRAVLAAEHAGLQVDRRSRSAILKAIERNRKMSKRERLHRRPSGEAGRTAATGTDSEAMELAARVCLPRADQSSMGERTAMLAPRPPRWEKEGSRAEQNYFNTYLLFFLEGPAWRSWRADARDALTTDREAGSTADTGSGGPVPPDSDVRAVALEVLTLKLCGQDRRWYPPESTPRKR